MRLISVYWFLSDYLSPISKFPLSVFCHSNNTGHPLKSNLEYTHIAAVVAAFEVVDSTDLAVAELACKHTEVAVVAFVVEDSMDLVAVGQACRHIGVVVVVVVVEDNTGLAVAEQACKHTGHLHLVDVEAPIWLG